jgi:hypothetical protein
MSFTLVVAMSASSSKARASREAGRASAAALADRESANKLRHAAPPAQHQRRHPEIKARINATAAGAATARNLLGFVIGIKRFESFPREVENGRDHR